MFLWYGLYVKLEIKTCEKTKKRVNKTIFNGFLVRSDHQIDVTSNIKLSGISNNGHL